MSVLQHPFLDGAHFAAIEAAGDLAKWHQWTAEHSLRVMKYAVGLGRALDADEEILDAIGVASLLHDIGKTAIPVSVLNKPASLTAGEWGLIRAHPQLGAEIAARLGYGPQIQEMILGHHEHWNGTGYPFGFTAENIPHGARMICIADIFDALTTPRSYRGALPPEHALDIMEIESGMIMDPTLFAVFKALVLDQLETGYLFGVSTGAAFPPLVLVNTA